MTSTDSTTEPARCRGCRHVIRSVESLATGYGAGCRAKMRKTAKTADLSTWTPSQVEEARQAIEDGAVVPSARKGVFHIVSSDGSEVYRTHTNGCVCANGLLTRPARPCWHRAAVAIVLGVTAAAPRPALVPAAPVIVPADFWAEMDRLTDAFMAIA